MKLITELNEEVELVTEETNGKKNYFIEGIFLQTEMVNRNGRKYSRNIMEKEVARYNREIIEKNRAFGELGHPSGPSINLDRVSHIITELRQDGNNFIGKAKITDTPMGHIARGIMESGGQLGVSSRAMGSLKEENGVMVVQSDLRISTAADIVADPSAPDAFVHGIMEGVEWIFDPIKESWIQQKAEDIVKEIHSMSKSQLEEKKLSLFEDYLTTLTLKFN
jgi:hypothetical protein